MPKKKTIREVRQKIYDLSDGKVKLLSDQYVNNRQKLELMCECGNIFYRDYGHIERGQIFCPECSVKYQHKKISLDIEYVKNEINKTGCKYISGKYTNNNSKLLIQCRCGNYFYKSWGKFSMGQDRCPECGREMTKGENHYKYKGGFSPMNHTIRAKLTSWKNTISNIYNNTCPISGNTNDLVIHHLTSFNTIFYDVLSKYDQYKNIDTQNICINDFQSEQDYYDIEDKIIEQHNKYSGILISNDIHKLFHSEYGYGNNTPQQFNEFLVNHYSVSLYEIQFKYIDYQERMDG